MHHQKGDKHLATYTYDDYTKRLKESGLNMSDADSRIAQSNPDAGMSLITYKQDFDNATNDSAKALAHANAEEIRRRYGNYSGGADGSGFALVTDNPAYTPNWDNQIAGEYQNMQKGFSWSPESDPLTKYYTKAYEREGQRAFDNAIGSLAARTGGQASSYAASAAAQAQNNYMQQLTDKYPELYQQAYNNFLSEYQRHAQNAQAFQSQDNIEYTRYLNDLANERQRRQDQAAADQQAWENEYTDRAFAENQRQYNTSMSETKREFDAEMDYKLKSLNANEQEAAKDLAYKYAALYQSGKQADAELTYKYQALSQSAQEFVKEMAYKYATLDENARQADLDDDYRYASLKESARQANLADVLSRDKMANDNFQSGLDRLTTNEKQALNKAVTAANYGDFSLLEDLGIDPSMYRQYVLGQMGAPVEPAVENPVGTPEGYQQNMDNTFGYNRGMTEDDYIRAILGSMTPTAQKNRK